MLGRDGVPLWLEEKIRKPFFLFILKTNISIQYLLNSKISSIQIHRTGENRQNCIYSDNQKTQVITLNSPIRMGKQQLCSVNRPISRNYGDLVRVCFVTHLSIAFNYCYKVVFQFLAFTFLVLL